MEGNSSIYVCRMQQHAGIARIEALAGLVAAGWRALSGWIEALGESQRRAQARRELRNLDDHFLKDIGLERGQIDRLFR